MKRKSFGKRLVAGMTEGLTALKRGEPLSQTYRPSMPRPPILTKRGVVKIRMGFGFTQNEFSKLMMVSPKTIQSWEQGTRRPSGTALRILQILQSPETLKPIIRFHAAKNQQKPKVSLRKVTA